MPVDCFGFDSPPPAWTQPLISEDRLKRPVRFTLESRPDALRLFLNKAGHTLGLVSVLGDGFIFMLPEYQDNEYIINSFLDRVLPRILRRAPKPQDIVARFKSCAEQEAHQRLETIENDRRLLDERYEQSKQNRAAAERLKRTVIEGDETAVRIAFYYKQAIQDEGAALFYLYKVLDALQKRFGGETAAKQTLGRATEWKLIGKIANASYGDTRHAPNPGEKIRQWTKEEIDECFSATETVIHAYFFSLFGEIVNTGQR